MQRERQKSLILINVDLFINLFSLFFPVALLQEIVFPAKSPPLMPGAGLQRIAKMQRAQSATTRKTVWVVILRLIMFTRWKVSLEEIIALGISIHLLF